MTARGRLLVIAGILVLIGLPTIARSATLLPPISTASAQQSDWPTTEWKASTPEQQGMDSTALAKLLSFIREQNIQLHSLLIIRHGYIVTEAYFYPYTPDIRHDIYSCTKSVTSALVGIALTQGYIDSVDHRVLDFFPNETFANTDDLKRRITLEHLLTMSSGLAWTESYSPYLTDVFSEWIASNDWVKYVLDRPVIHDPGTKWNYNTAAVHVLSAIIQKTSGTKTATFAQQYLFKPIGITSAFWPDDPNGISRGGEGLQLTPRDMARFGYLYLRQGQWEGREILPIDWVSASTQPQLEIAGNEIYGYLWWLEGFGGYAAKGSGGQAIFVVPEQDLVVVMTGGLGLRSGAIELPDTLVRERILPAVKSLTPLPVNAQGMAQLTANIQAVGQAPAPEPLTTLSNIARAVDGKPYQLENNGYGLKSFTLHFKLNQQEAVMERAFEGGQQSFTLGLDGLYRMTQLAPGYTVAAKGVWQSPNRFAITWLAMESGFPAGMSMTFRPDGSVSVWMQEGVGHLESIEGTSAKE